MDKSEQNNWFWNNFATAMAMTTFSLFMTVAAPIHSAMAKDVDRPKFPEYRRMDSVTANAVNTANQASSPKLESETPVKSEQGLPPWEQKSTIVNQPPGPGGRDSGFPINIDVDSPAFPARTILGAGKKDITAFHSGAESKSNSSMDEKSLTASEKTAMQLFPNNLKRAMELKNLEKRPVFPAGPEKDIAGLGPRDSRGYPLTSRPYIPSLPAYCGKFNGFTARRAETLLGRPFENDEPAAIQNGPRVPMELRPGRPVNGNGRYLPGTGPESPHPEMPMVPSGS
ncbi:MAG: hypothetical protein CVV64_04670 [Candidatus Wallbacteria bacterium HGW-Wallbacteria-1]|uniref:Uncharacterized protein n=1 Tax=Candidatus Wallbacteria bacterium HGW-Wallbacteria-1 TaxID=2013854 RepID=A0A2N1PRV5_9BACT|nr:MAG: hypothetical protein CVV64_04670 [Candidatus Wallbacteria bacterium HGW-Wallbacteria-1]